MVLRPQILGQKSQEIADELLAVCRIQFSWSDERKTRRCVGNLIIISGLILHHEFDDEICQQPTMNRGRSAVADGAKRPG